MSDTSQELQLSDYLNILRRQRVVLIMVPLVIFAIVTALTLSSDEVYESSARVLVRTAETDPLFEEVGDLNTRLQRNAITELQYTDSQQFRRAVDTETGFPSALDVEIQEVDQDIDEDGVSGVLIFTARADTAQRAQEAANTAARVYIDERAADDIAALERRQQILRERIDNTQSELQALLAPIRDLDARILEADDAQVIAQLNESRQQLQNEIREEREFLEQVESSAIAEFVANNELIEFIGQPDSTARVVLNAPLRADPVEPQVARTLTLAAVIAIIIGVAVAIVRDLLDDRIGDDASSLAGIRTPVIGSIPTLRSSRNHPGGVLPLSKSDARLTDAYRSLRNTLMVHMDDQPIRSIAVTSAEARVGKTQTVVNFGEVAADLGARVVLVEADLHTPDLASRMGGAIPPHGLCDVLAGDVELDDALYLTNKPDITLLAAGLVPANPSDLLVGDAFAQVIKRLDQRYDVILIDLPPVLGLSDAPVAARSADAVIVVYDSKSGGRKKLEQAITMLEVANTNVVGLVANRSDRLQTSYVSLE